MFKFKSVKSVYRSCINHLRNNRVVRAKHFNLIDRALNDTDINVEKLEVYIKAREKKVTEAISKIKASIKMLNDRNQTQKIEQLQQVFTDMANANDHNMRLSAEHFAMMQKHIEEVEKKISTANRKIKLVQQYEKNMLELENKQQSIMRMIDDFRVEVIENRKLKESIKPEYVEIKRDFALQIEDVKGQFTTALGIQCQDMIRQKKSES
jgi:DNA repair ATPase RecN